jgi:uncharacterized Zn-finger protein
MENIVVKPKRFQCARCLRRFARLEHLQRHERTRMLCPPQFLRSSVALTHCLLDLDTRERPFPCKLCESRFTRR